jgi:hypothetical protein
VQIQNIFFFKFTEKYKMKTYYNDSGLMSVLFVLVFLLSSITLYYRFFAYEPIQITVCQTQTDYIAILKNGQIFRGNNVDEIVGRAVHSLFLKDDEGKMISLKVLPNKVRIITTHQSE